MKERIILLSTLVMWLAGFGLASAQSCVTPPSGLVSWWPGDGDAKDIIDGNDGILKNSASWPFNGLVTASVIHNSYGSCSKAISCARIAPTRGKTQFQGDSSDGQARAAQANVKDPA